MGKFAGNIRIYKWPRDFKTLFNFAAKFKNNTTEALRDLVVDENGNFHSVHIKSKKRNIFVFCDPDSVRDVLSDNRAVGKLERLRDIFSFFNGTGIFTAAHEEWQGQRPVINDFLNNVDGSARKSVLEAIPDIATAHIRDMNERGYIEPYKDMRAMTLDVLLEALLKVDLTREEKTDLIDGVHALNEALVPVTRWAILMPFPALGRFIAKHKLSKDVKAVERVLEKILNQHFNGILPEDSFVSVLVRSHGLRAVPSKAQMRQLKEELFQFLVAGHETTASALTWSLYHLAHDPERQALVAADIHQNIKGHDPYEFGKLKKIASLRETVTEALRVYPLPNAVPRQAMEDIVVGGVDVPKGSYIIIPLDLMHQNPEFTDQSCVFDPSRHARDTKAGESQKKSVNLPFLSGPHTCPGAGVFFTEAYSFLVQLLRDHSILPKAGETIPGKNVGIIATPAVNQRLYITRRDAAMQYAPDSAKLQQPQKGSMKPSCPFHKPPHHDR